MVNILPWKPILWNETVMNHFCQTLTRKRNASTQKTANNGFEINLPPRKRDKSKKRNSIVQRPAFPNTLARNMLAPGREKQLCKHLPFPQRPFDTQNQNVCGAKKPHPKNWFQAPATEKLSGPLLTQKWPWKVHFGSKFRKFPRTAK